MLCNIQIKDLAVVESLDLELEPGFTVLTGETGAGKSILLTAIGLALGDRADSGFIRAGCAKAEINLEFSLIDAPQARQWLVENELLDDESENGCLIRRIISQDGRSKAFINNRPATLQSLQDLSSSLIEIHGQHAHLHLLQPPEQRRLLDESCQTLPLVEALSSLYSAWRTTRDKLDFEIDAASHTRAREELLRFQIEELEKHEVETLDYDALSEEHNLQANAGKILSIGQQQLEALYEDERNSVTARLAQAHHGLADLAQLAAEFGEPAALIHEAQIQIKEASLQLRRQLEKLEADPNRLQWLDEKLGDLHRLARKHQLQPRQLSAHLQELQAELNGIANFAGRIEQLEKELRGFSLAFTETATQLSMQRHTGALELQKRVTEIVRGLGMPQAQFSVLVTSDEERDPNPHGYDTIEFQVSSNPGLPPRPLTKVASGGELSRLSLAIQVAATDSKIAPSLIFDEVDTGIGGGVAEIVGEKLRTLSTGRQVFCVTHLHQVAAQGHHHLLVEKLITADNFTQTSVRALGETDRKHEIARMLGGIRITEQTLAHAAEILDNHNATRLQDKD